MNKRKEGEREEEYEYEINNFYDFFKLKKDCSQPEIRKRYNMFLLTFHPDKNQHLNNYPKYEKIVKKTNEITMLGGKILLNRKARKIYNKLLLCNQLPPHANVFYENLNILNIINQCSGDKNDLFS